MSRKRLTLSNGQFGNLGTTFTRDVATVDDFAQSVAAGVPRYGRPVVVSDYEQWSTASNTTFYQVFCGAGKSADGAHDLICYLLPDAHTFKIVKDHSFNSPLFTRDINRTDKVNHPINDIFKGTGDLETNRAWAPRFGVVCHGLLVMRSDVYDWNNTSWDLTGTGIISFAINASTGALTFVRRDFIADPGAAWLNYPRGQFFSMTGYTPDPHYTDPPLAAWFAITDYANNPNSPGGYAMIMRATRASVSSAWVAEPAVMIHSSIQTDRHFHSAVAQVKSANVLDVLISVGDASHNQSLVLRCSNKSNYYTGNPPVAANWTLYNHGVDGMVNQWAGGVLGPDNNHIVGADGTSEAIVSAKTPDAGVDPSVTKASLDYLFGAGTSGNHLLDSLWAHTDCPERRRNYVSRIEHHLNDPMPENSICFSPDGRAWCVIADMPSNTEVPFISGDRIYLTSLSSSGGIRYIPIPKTRVGRPLRLGPGGMQWVKPGVWVIDGIEDNISTFFLDKGANGKWQDDDVDLPNQPPTEGRVLKVVNTGTNTFEGRNRIAGIQSETPYPTNGKIFIRWWGMPFKGRQNAVIATLDSGIGQLSAARQYSACPGTFTPHLLTANITNPPNENYGRWLAIGDMEQNGNFYMASDLIVTGSDPVPGYPMPAGRGTTPLDENLTVTGLGLGSRWAVAVYGIIPWDSWDSTYSYFDGTNSHPMVDEVPLWTLYIDATHHIAVVADIAHDKMLFRVTDGATNGTSE